MGEFDIMVITIKLGRLCFSIGDVLVRSLRVVAAIVILYFGSLYFAASALLPDFALQIALVGLIIGLAAYQYLLNTRGERPSLAYAVLLYGVPFACVFAGVIWWLLRLLGFW